MSQSSEIFCPLPWLGYSIRSDGQVRVCCHANQGKNRGILFKDDDTPYTYKDGITESRNSKTLKDIRKYILNNEWYPDCIRCKNEFTINIRSRNVYETNGWSEYINKNDALRLTKSDGSIRPSDFPLHYFDLRFGNLCNLRCRMCGSGDSSSWYTEQYEVFKHSFDNEKMLLKKDGNKYYVENDPFLWHKDDYFWRDLEAHIKHMKFCYIVGGEPLLVKKHYNFLEKCISMKAAKDITIEYNTNGTYLPGYAHKLWDHFKAINFGISLDGVGKINEYIRYPSKWRVVESNIRKLDESNKQINLWLSATVMVYNILHMPELLNWKLEQNYSKMKSVAHRPIMATHLLHTPPFLNIKIFPQASKEFIEQLFEESINKFQKETTYSDLVKSSYKTLLNGYVKFMMQDDYTEHIYEFFKYNDKLDNSRNQKLEDYISGLRELL